MLPSPFASVPSWIVYGALLGIGLSLLVAVLFYVIVRFFPSEQRVDDRSSSGDGRRRGEIRRYLEEIGEQYVEDRVVEGQRVAFYLPRRGVAITFDARAFYRIDQTARTPVLVEQELPGLALGARLPFDTPTVEFEDDKQQPRTSRERAFAILGLPANATVEQVQAAYREKVKDVHPDLGGDEEAFKRVREAYTTAKQDSS